MDYSYTLLLKKNVSVYKLPNLTTAKGHYLESWRDKIWVGHLKVCANDDNLMIELLNHDFALYAKCPIGEDSDLSVQKCTDSSRGFAIKLVNDDGRSMWVGLGFHDRNDAFDLQCCLQDFARRRDEKRNPQANLTDNVPTMDFSLKEGEQISLNIHNGPGSGQFDNNKFNNKGFSGGGFENFKIAPPPGSGSNQNTGSFNQNNNFSQSKPKVDFFGEGFGGPNTNSNFNIENNTQQSRGDIDFFGQGSSNRQQQPQGNAIDKNSLDLFETDQNNQPQNFNNFGGFGNTQPQTNNNQVNEDLI